MCGSIASVNVQAAQLSPSIAVVENLDNIAKSSSTYGSFARSVRNAEANDDAGAESEDTSVSSSSSDSSSGAYSGSDDVDKQNTEVLPPNQQMCTSFPSPPPPPPNPPRPIFEGSTPLE